MAHSTLPAVQWFERERLRVEHLIYMTVPNQSARLVEFYFRAKLPEDEQDIVNGMCDGDDVDYVGSDEQDSSTGESKDASSEDEESLAAEVQDLGKEDAGLMRPPNPMVVEEPAESLTSLHPDPYKDVQFGTERPEVTVSPAIISHIRYGEDDFADMISSCSKSSRSTPATAGSMAGGIASAVAKSFFSGRKIDRPSDEKSRRRRRRLRDRKVRPRSRPGWSSISWSRGFLPRRKRRKRKRRIEWENKTEGKKAAGRVVEVRA